MNSLINSTYFSSLRRVHNTISLSMLCSQINSIILSSRSRFPWGTVGGGKFTIALGGDKLPGDAGSGCCTFTDFLIGLVNLSYPLKASCSAPGTYLVIKTGNSFPIVETTISLTLSRVAGLTI